MKHLHTYKYKVLGKGPIKQKPIKIKIWLGGFALGYLTKRHMGGFVLTFKKTPHPINPVVDSYTQKYR
jgi:hypothetical protein